LDGDKPPLDEALRDLAARARRDLGSHPTPEQLAAYHAGELREDEVDRIQEHLALCHECSELLLDLADFEDPGPPTEVPGLTDADVDAAWQDLKARMAGQSAPERPTMPAEIAASTKLAEPVPKPPPENVVALERRDPLGPSWKVGYGLAAMLALAVVGLSVWAGSLYRQVEGLRRPQIATAPVALDPEGSGTRSGGEAPPSAQRPLSLTLYLDRVPDAPRYQVEILAVADLAQPLWKSDATETPPEDDFLSVTIPGSFLKPGSYLVRVRNIGGEANGRTTDFPFKTSQ
jgi:hypothetical protein